MPFNLLKNYNELLDINGMGVSARKKSLGGVFNRDFIERQPVSFRGKKVIPTPANGAIDMGTLFTHLTTEIVDQKTRTREYENERSQRLHWVRFHLDYKKSENVLHFSVKEPEGIRTYIYDADEKYVVILEPKHENLYFLLTAYKVRGRDAARNKMIKKYKRKLDEVI